MNKRRCQDREAVADLEAVVLLLTRAMLRLDYLNDYLAARGNRCAGTLREAVADSMCTASAWLEDETMGDAANAKRKKR